MSDLLAILQSIHDNPDDGPRWLALAAWFTEQGRDDEAAAVRVLWPTLRDNSDHATLEDTLAYVGRNARLLGGVAPSHGVRLILAKKRGVRCHCRLAARALAK